MFCVKNVSIVLIVLLLFLSACFAESANETEGADIDAQTEDDANAQEWEKVLTVEIYTYTSNTLLSDDTDSLFVNKSVRQEDNTLACSITRYDLNQGKQVWSVPPSRSGGLLFANSDMLFIGAFENMKGTRTHYTGDVHVKALSLQTGEQVWEFIDKGVSSARKFLLGKNYVVYQRTGMWKGKQTLESLDASFLDIKTGEVKRTVNSGKAIINKVVTIEQEDYLLAADDNAIYCYKAGTGAKTGTYTPFENSEYTLNIKLAVATDAELYVCVEKLKPPVAPSKSRLRAGTKLMHLGLPGLALKKKVDLADYLEIVEEMSLEEDSVSVIVRPASGKGRKMLTVAKDLSGDIDEKKVEEVEEPEYPIISETIHGKYKLVKYKEKYEVYRMSENPAR